MPAAAQLGRFDAERRVLTEDRVLQSLELGPRLKAQLIAQRASHTPKGCECVDLTSTSVEREHQLAVEMLAERLIRNKRLEFGNELEMPREREFGLDSFLEGDQAQLLDPRDLALGKCLVGDVGKSNAAPEAERLAQHRCGRLAGARGQLASPLDDEPLEPLEVELSGFDPETVPGAFGRDPLVPQPLA